MAKSQFHKGQRVYVKPVGTFGRIEEVIPQWVKGLDEPIKIHYELGLGREFTAEELSQNGDTDAVIETDVTSLNWRIVRCQNRCGDTQEDHPVPGTHPSVVTDEKNWGGWRVPRAEYERNPERIEFQARMLSRLPDMMNLAKYLVEMGNRQNDLSEPVQTAIRQAQRVLSDVYRTEVA